MRAPLLGIKVLDFTQFLAGPICTRAMVEMGAEIVKIEAAPSGDHARALPVVRDGRSAYFVQQNLGKKSVAVNLREPRGLDLVKRMIPRADVLVENFAPGVMARLGLDWASVRALNPELIMCSISAFGQKGPLARLPGFDFIGQAYSGVLSMIGDPDEPPPFATIGVGDVGSGTCALAAINAALFARTRGGGGTYIDVSILDFYFHSLGLSVEMIGMTGGAVQPTRSGRHHITLAPLGIFKGRQGYVLIGPVSKDMWQRLAKAMGRAELITDERFLDNDARRAPAR